MALGSGTQVLDNSYINGVFQGLVDPRSIPGKLLFSQRVADVPAEDGEIMMQTYAQIQIADLVADDQRAGLYSSGQSRFISTNIPNLKVGSPMTQAQLSQWQAINNNPGAPQYIKDLFSGSMSSKLNNLKIGVAQRKEALLAAMAMDSFDYEKMGIKMSGVTWFMPSYLKVTLTGTDEWNDPVHATPVSNVLDLKYTAEVKNGKTFNRVTMTTPAFQLMISTAEFQAKARMYLAPNVSFVNLNSMDTMAMTGLAEAVLKMQVVLYNGRFWDQQPNGLWVQSPFLDLDAVIIDDSADDKNKDVQNWANGIVTESLVSSIVGDNVIPGGPQFGPVAYAIPKQDYNAPGIEYWAVARGFPRKQEPGCSACLRIGDVTETLPVELPF